MIRFASIFLLVGLFPSQSVRAQGIFEGPTQLIPVEVDRMYVKGLNFLRDHQKEDGAFSTPGRSDSYGSQPGVVGLAIVAMMAQGMTQTEARMPWIRRGLNLLKTKTVPPVTLAVPCTIMDLPPWPWRSLRAGE